MSVRLFVWLKVSEMSWPNVYPAPRGDIPQPARSSGSDQRRSHIGPYSGKYSKIITRYYKSSYSSFRNGYNNVNVPREEPLGSDPKREHGLKSQLMARGRREDKRSIMRTKICKLVIKISKNANEHTEPSTSAVSGRKSNKSV